MKIQQSNIKGFTLVELLIALVIMSIVVTTGISVVQMVNKSFANYQKTQSEFMAMESNNMLLSSRFLTSKNITFSRESHVLSFDSNPKYTFEIRNDFVNTLSKDTLFQNLEFTSVDLFVSDKNTYIVTELSFDVLFGERKIPFTYSKKYDIQTRLNYPKRETYLLK